MAEEYYQGTDDLANHDPPERIMISAHTLWRAGRKSHFPCKKWMLDSGAFTQMQNYGRFILSVREYAHMIKRFSDCGELICAIAQDYMCEPFMLELTGRTVRQNQHDTVARYFELADAVREIGCMTPIMPVLQGWEPEQYVDNLEMYCYEWRCRHYDLARRFDNRLRPIEIPERIAIGTMCKRNGKPFEVLRVLSAITPHLQGFKLHALGLKKTALRNDRIASMLHSSDSAANAFHDVKNGKSRRRVDRRISDQSYYDDMETIIKREEQLCIQY